ncbi:hypothetical protein HK104_001969, partial [Borealophlyctis nickersoniae]
MATKSASRAKSAQRSRSDKLDESSPSASTSSVNVSAKGTPAPPEVVYKMSKKIAQLTKVIYYLNTKNEDHNVEVQSLVDAYEDEVSEVMRDAQSRIEDLNVKVEESEIKLHAHEEVIQSYLETISKNEQDLKTARELEVELKIQIANDKKLGDLIQEMEKRHQAELDDARNTVKDFGRTDDELNAVKSAYEEKMQEQTEQFDRIVDDIRRQCNIQLEDMKTEHERKIKQMSEERQRMDDSAKDTVAALKKRVHGNMLVAFVNTGNLTFRIQHEDEMKFFQQEVKRLKTLLDDQSKDARAQYEALEKKLRDEYNEEHQKVVECERIIAENRLDSQKKADQIRDLEGELSEKLTLHRRLDAQYQITLNRVAELEKDYEATIGKLRATEYRVASMLLENEQKDEKIQEIETLASQLRMEVDGLRLELEETSANLTASISTIKDVTEQLRVVQMERDELDTIRSERENELRALQELMETKLKEAEETLRTSLEELETRLTTAHRAEVEELTARAEERYATLEDEKAKAIADFEQQIADLKTNHETRLAVQKKRFEEETAAFQTRIAKNLEDNKELQRKLDATTATLEEKMVEISKHLITIQHHLSTIKNLENDKADLFQKMVHIDEKIRSEMLEKFRRDKLEMEEDWERKMIREMESMRASLEQAHAVEMQSVLQQKQTQHEEELAKVNKAHDEAIKALEAQIDELKTRIDVLDYERQMAIRQFLEMKDTHSREISSLTESHQIALKQERKHWELEAQARETQLKVASTIALANLEKKCQAEKEELEAAHKEKLDELRGFHTMKALAAKKEAETLRVTELTKLQTEHEQALSALRDEHAKTIHEKIVELNAKHSFAVKQLTEKQEAALTEKKEEIESLEGVIEDMKLSDRVSQSRIHELEYDLGQLQEQLVAKDNEIDALREENAQNLRDLETRLKEEQAQEIERLNEEHIQDSERMLREFEQAQAFLKREIANQAKLYDAEIKYINREPREVDLQRIEELEDDIRRRKRKIAGLMGELDYYRLELNNREANFNKIFNKTPLVGIIQPLTGK